MKNTTLLRLFLLTSAIVVVCAFMKIEGIKNADKFLTAAMIMEGIVVLAFIINSTKGKKDN